MPASGKDEMQQSFSGRRRFLKTAGAAGVVGITGFAGCLSDGGETPTTTSPGGSGGNQTITLGASISETGNLANEGNLYLDSYKMTIEDVNEQGGVDVNGTTHDLELTYYDDESSASTARQLYQRLIEQDGVNYLLGPYSSGVTLSAQPIVQQHQLPMVQGGGASSEIFGDDNEYVFGMLATANNYADGALATADTFSNPEVTKLALAVENTTFSQDAARGVRNLAEQYGWDIVVDQSFPTGTDDISSIVNAVGDAEPQVFVMSGHYQHAVLAANQFQQYGVNVPMSVATVGATPQSFIEETGSAGQYWYGTSQWASSANYDGFFYGTAPDYVDAFTSTYDYQPDYHNAAGSACVLTYMNAFQNASELSPDAVHQALVETDIQTSFAAIQFGPNLSNKAIKPVAYQWQDGSKALVGPPSIATDEAVYPAPTYSER